MSSEKKKSKSNQAIDFDDVQYKYDKGLHLQTPTLTSRDWCLLTVVVAVGFIVRFFRLTQPNSVVFDEVHFGGFASKFLKREFFFDVHPPLAKLLITFVGWLSGFDGSFDFKEIGLEYAGTTAPYIAMRGFMALFGLGLVPCAYLTMKYAGMTTESSLLASIFVLFENGLVTQSRYIFLDAPLILFTGTTVLAWTRFHNYQDAPFSSKWWQYLILTGVSLGLVVSCKWVGLFTIALIGLSTVKNLWDMLINPNITMSNLGRHFIARAIALIVIPIAIYMFTFHIQFEVLNNYSKAAEIMSMEYQNTMNGNPFDNFPKEIAYGSKVYINHYNTRGGFLHSHASNYPGGTKQQQITLYPFRDINNWWEIKHPLTFDSKVNETIPEGIIHIKNGDIIRLEHVSTKKRLHSHNERPGTTDKEYMNEVTGYGFAGFEGDSNDHWTVEIVEGDSRDAQSSDTVQAVYTKFRLKHNSGCYLYSRNHKLPDWGFGQAEVLCMKEAKAPKTIWYVEKNEHPDIPNPTDVVTYNKKSFFGKFIELNIRMWTSNADLTSSHPFDSRPTAWPVLRRGISFWSKDNKQVYLIGNIFIWYLATLSVLSFFAIQAVLIILEKRQIRTIPQQLQDYYFNWGGFLVGGWLLHYLPFFLMKRQLFLHHYFPALYISILMFTFSFDTLTKRFNPQTRMAFVIVLSLVAIFVFLKFSPIAYGLQWTQAKCRAAQFLSNWDFDCNKPLN